MDTAQLPDRASTSDCQTSGRGRVCRRRWLIALVLIGGAFAGLVWFGVVVWRSDYHIGAMYVYGDLLKTFARGQGRMPQSLNELIELGYMRIDNNGDVRLRARFHEEGYLRGYPRFFNVLWGVSAEKVDAHGFVKSQGRYVVELADGSPCNIWHCRTMSLWIALAFQEHAMQPATAAGP